MTSSTQAQWPMKALRRLVTIRSSNVDKIVEEGEETVRLCNYVDVYYNDRITGDIEFSEGSAKPQEITKFALRTGDVIITKDSETPDDIAVPALVDSSAEGIVCGYHLAILQPNPSEIIGPFLFWSLKAKPTREAFSLAAQGVTRYGLTLNGIGSVNIPLPDLPTQKAIAAFLDRETARIDKLIANLSRSVTLLKEMRVAVVATLLKRDGAAMSASSKRLKYLVVSQNRKLAYSETNPAYIGLENIESWTGRLLPGERTEPEGTVSLYEAGDILFGKLRPYLAKVHLTEEVGVCSTEALVLRPQRSLHPAYLKYVLLDPKRIDEINASTFGSQMPRASWDFIGNCKIFVPDLPRPKSHRRLPRPRNRPHRHADREEGAAD